MGALAALLVFIGAACLAGQVPPPIPTDRPGPRSAGKGATLEGRTENDNGATLPHVMLTLRGGGAGQMFKYTARSDAQGRFVFEQVEPGQYTLTAEKPGFVRQSAGGRRGGGSTVSLTASEDTPIKDIVLRLVPQGVISGRVTDENGEPVERVSVLALQWRYLDGKRLLRPATGAITDDLGAYRIRGLAPGSYYIAARSDQLLRAGVFVQYGDAPAASVPEGREEAHQTTYYPGSIDPAGASPLLVAPGADLGSIDIRFLKAPVFRVRGEVIDDVTGRPVADFWVSLTPVSPVNVISMSSVGGPRISGGKFEVLAVSPGAYYLIAYVTGPGETRYARQPVFVTDQNVTDLRIHIPRVVEVSGSVRLEPSGGQASEQSPSSQQKPTSPDAVRIYLQPVEGFGVGETPVASAAAGGRFVMRGVVPDKYRVAVTGLPAGSYLKSILVAGQERPDGSADIAGSAPIEIVLASGAAQLTGSVTDSEGKPASDVELTLFPESPERQRRRDLFRVTTSDQDGQFRFTDVAPGDYKVLAWQNLEAGAIQDPEFRRQFEAKAKSVSLGVNGQESVELKEIPAEEIARVLGR
ncbi:MAG TPA: carboxypeptidase-like regulatory domain-containing protein [Bryobacteraceae bacterium]|nr:carboxypeptidase-like regulatory domain-containing protein [Bryobacteraceae bacterium]